ncbi:MAG: ferrochelatase [Bacteroidales bacterium]|nr:ferrochelatase [Bacteroidales bacterium]
MVLLINLGTPDSPKTGDVRKYLTSFLNDPRVIDLPWLARKLLVNLVIVPFRSRKSAALYRSVWTAEGSPLLIHTKRLRDALQVKLGKVFAVEMAMRYGNPSLKAILGKIKVQQPERIILVPLYPQYASSTTGSTLERVLKIIGRWKQIPEVKMIHHFHDHEGFIKSFSQRINTYNPKNYDHVIMSFHGLPNRQVNASHQGIDCAAMGCSEKRQEGNRYCYRASCYETASLLADSLQLKKDEYTVCFQSRFSKNWTTPFTDEVVKELAKTNKKRLLVVSPSFVTDCLETIHELGTELREDFEKNGGAQLTLVESLNDFDPWVDALASMTKNC